MFKENLVLTPLAENQSSSPELPNQLFAEAAQIDRQIKLSDRPLDKWYDLYSLAFAYVDLGLNIDPVMQRLYLSHPTVNQPLMRDRYLLGNLVELQAYSGDLAGAKKLLQTAEAAGGQVGVEKYLALARAAHEAGEDFQVYLEKATHIAGNRYQERGEAAISNEVETDLYQQIFDLMKVAEAQVELGVDIRGPLYDLYMLVRQYDAKYDNENSGGPLFQKIARLYARRGFFTMALKIAERNIWGTTSEENHYSTKKATYSLIASEQIKQGDYEGALSTAEISKSAEVQAEVYCECAEHGYQADELLNRARTLIQGIPDSYRQSNQQVMIALYSDIGKVEQGLGVEPTGFHEAFALATQQTSFSAKIESYQLVAKMITEAGFDARPVLASALKRLEKAPIVAESDYDLAGIEIMLEDFVEDAIDMGYLDLAERAIQHMDADFPHFVVRQKIALLRAKAKTA